MFDAGIVDPTKVTRAALQNAASVASLMLTTGRKRSGFGTEHLKVAPPGGAQPLLGPFAHEAPGAQRLRVQPAG